MNQHQIELMMSEDHKYDCYLKEAISLGLLSNESRVRIETEYDAAHKLPSDQHASCYNIVSSLAYELELLVNPQGGE